MSQSSDNKRIAKNTLLLYLRMLFMMGISLFTSRVVLNALGVEDYGIYNVVGGIVTMFGFINSSMASATQRYITFALAKGDKQRLSTVFSVTLQTHALIAAIIVLLSETVGVWFLYHKMQIPPERMDAAFWVLQCSIVNMVVAILSVPYNACIIAHERMSAFAYISIVEAVLKLAIVYLLLISPFDKLVVYAVLLLLVQVMIRFCYSIYCNRHFAETKYRRVWDVALLKEMTGFAGWNVFGSLSALFCGEGLNMLLNVFFGPVVNAARGVAMQVQSAIQQFVGNFQTALNPQITKKYAIGDFHEMHQLMFRSARFSFFLLFLLSLPVLFETEFILRVWLKTVPENTVIFLRLIICTSLIYTLANPILVGNSATGKVRTYYLVCGTLMMSILPVSYIALRMGCPAYSVFVVHFSIEAITQCFRMVMVRKRLQLSVRKYIRQVYVPIAAVVCVSVIPPFLVYHCVEGTILQFFLVSFVCVASVGIVSLYVGLTKSERTFVLGYIMTKLKIRKS